MYFKVDSIDGRRVRPEDGVVEYKTHWSGYDATQDTWEPRGHMTELCAEAVQAVDQAEMEETDRRLVRWRRQHWGREAAEGQTDGTRDVCLKRPRPPPEEADAAKEMQDGNGLADVQGDDGEELEVLPSVLVRNLRSPASPASSSPTSRPSPKSTAAPASATTTTGDTALSLHEQASVVMLGEIVLTEEAAAYLGSATKRHRGRAGKSAGQPPYNGGSNGSARAGPGEHGLPELCASAMTLEKAWRARFAVSLMHSCASGATACTPLAPNFAFHVGDETLVERERAMAVAGGHPGASMEILGLVPVEASRSAKPFREPTTFVPWIGEEEAERLRHDTVADYPALGPAAQDILRPQREHMAVRYALTRFVEEDEEGKKGEGEEEQQQTGRLAPQQIVASMPLTVFREAFPQLLLDYLLAHAVVLEG